MSSVCFSAFFTRLFTGEKKNSNDNIKKRVPFSHLKELSVKEPIHTKGSSAFRCFKFVRAAHFFFVVPVSFFFPSTLFRLHSLEKVSKRKKRTDSRVSREISKKTNYSCPFLLALCLLLFSIKFVLFFFDHLA